MINLYHYYRYSECDYDIGDSICFNINGFKKYYLQDGTQILKIHGRFPTRGSVDYCWKGVILS